MGFNHSHAGIFPTGKDDGIAGCLKQFKNDDKNLGYTKYCIEESPYSTYFVPQIRLRMQTCGFISCWTKLHDFSYNGECVWWATGYLAITKRFCARIAMPSNFKEDGTDDDGYIRDKHINKEGIEEEDSFKDSDGNIIDLKKFCVYDDPCALQLLQGVFDPVDTNPYYQPNHKAPSIDVSFLGSTIQSAISLFLPNKIVNNSIGCIIPPIGPNPPPYYRELKPPEATINVERICENVNTEYSKASNCVLSKVDNNFIHNAIRVGFDDALPLCHVLSALDSGERNFINSDLCANIKSQDNKDNIIDQLLDTMVLTYAHNNNDSLPLCSNSTPPCIKNIQRQNIPPNIKENIRILYGSSDKNNNIIMNNNGAFDKNNKDNQTIWGVNLGNYKDIVINLDDPSSKVSKQTTITKQTTIKDNNGEIRIIDTKISFKDNENNNTEEICAKDSKNSKWYCFKRPDPPRPKVYSCSSNLGKQFSQCQDDSHFRPHLIAQILTGSYKIQEVIESYNETSQESTDNINIAPLKKINLLGKDYNVFVTDKEYNTIPFTEDSTSKDAGTLRGTYKDGLYLTGMEYNNFKYKMGGAYICLTDPDSDIYSCSINKQNCVLAKNLDIKSTDTEIRVSNKFEDRIWPRYQKDASNDLDNPIKYFDYESPHDKLSEEDRLYLSDSICQVKDVNKETDINKIFDTKKCGMRSKTAMEHNLCIEIPKLECPAIQEANESTGHATWDKAFAGDESTGKCLDGYEPATGPLKRFCTINFNEKKAMFEPITDKMICRKTKIQQERERAEMERKERERKERERMKNKSKKNFWKRLFPW